MTEKLAIDGGSPVRTVPFPTWPQVDRVGIDAVDKVLASGNLNYHFGDEGIAFEKTFALYCEVPHALSVSNGTVALEVALRAWGVGPGDEVIVPSRTFVATAGAVVAVGASPIIADIDPITNCMTAISCAKVLTPRTKAIIPVHLGGYPAPLASIASLAAQVGAFVVEDCAQALGARSDGHPVGTQYEAGCFSFCQDKIIALGEGGMITLNNMEVYKDIWAFRDQGHTYDLAVGTAAGEARSGFRWMTEIFGTNARMTQMQSAMGLWGMDQLPIWHARRVENAQVLIDTMHELDGIEPCIPAAEDHENVHAFYRLYGLVDKGFLAKGWTRDHIIDAINSEGVPVQYGSCALIGEEKAFERAGIRVNPDLPGARVAHESSLAFFVHPTATVEDMRDVAEALRKVMIAATTQSVAGV